MVQTLTRRTLRWILISALLGVLATGVIVVATRGSDSTPNANRSVPPLAIPQNSLPCSQMTQLGLDGCAIDRIITANKKVNAEVAFLLRVLKNKRYERSLFVTSELAWRSYRSTTCKVVRRAFAGGSILPLEVANCEVGLDAHHSQELRALWISLNPELGSSVKFP